MDIFENLEQLNVSEECFDEIMGIVEELLNEKITMKEWTDKAKQVLPNRSKEVDKKEEAYLKSVGVKPEDKDKFYKNGMIPDNKEYKELVKAADRLRHANTVSHLKKGSGSASVEKVMNATNKVADKRAEAANGHIWAMKSDPNYKNVMRLDHAAALGNNDPVKSKIWKRNS
jgi:hypothetical protein